MLQAQTLKIIQENDDFIIYELHNDSLKLAIPYDLTIYVPPEEQAFQILEQEVIQQNSGITSTDLTLKPIIEVVGSGMIKKQRVTRVLVYQNRKQGSIDYITKKLKFKVFKKRESLKKASRIVIKDHPFASGTWMKIEFSKQGIYEITPAMLRDAGLNLSSIDPKMIQVWGLSGDMIPERNSAVREEFSQIPILVKGESDGVLDETDRIYFYGNSAYRSNRDVGAGNQPVFNHIIHHYSKTNAVFLTVGAHSGLRMSTANAGLQATIQVTKFTDHVWKEDELYKTEDEVRSGRRWLGQLFSNESFGRKQTIFSDTLPGFVNGSSVSVKIRYYARSTSNSIFTSFLGTQSLGTSQIQRITSLSEATGVSANFRNADFIVSNTSLAGSILTLSADFSNSAQGATGWVDFIDMEVQRELIAKRNYLQFFPPNDFSSNQIVQYVLKGFSSAPISIDASNAQTPMLLESTKSGESYLLNYVADPYKRIITQSTFYKPNSIKTLANQNISGTTFQPDYIVITSEELLDQAKRLAQYRSDKDGLKTLVVTQNEVFNEFSGGVPDILALRLVGKLFYDRATTSAELPSYLVFFGDTSYDYKEIEANSNRKNIVFTYQSLDFVDRVGSFGSDDFFGLYDSNEGSWASSSELIDLGIGRLPAQNESEAKILVDKIIHYESSETDFGDWRSLFMFIADDDFPDAAANKDLHVLNADGTTSVIDLDNSGIKLKKLYFFDYPVENTAGGRRYPQATRDFINTINNGALVTNYSGHGAEQVLADERFFVSNMIPQLTNYDRLTTFVTATCSFGRFDDNQDQSGAEKLVLHDKGGAIAALTTTRVVFTSSDPNSNNYGLNRVLTAAMTTRETGTNLPRRLGDIYFLTKTAGSVGPSPNSRRFVLLGDPATRLNLPKRSMRVTQINANPVSGNTVLGINSLEEVLVKGEVVGFNSALDASFNGEVLIQVRDAARAVSLPYTEAWGTSCYMPNCVYYSQNDILFNGRATVSNGQFSATFILPKDVGFTGGLAKILLYANNENEDATGAFNQITVTGINANASNDGVGPQMEVFMNDETFMQGVIVNSTPKLIVKIEDPSGINSAASGVGHEIIAKIKRQGDTEQTVVLNEFFTTDIDNYKKGEIKYTFNELLAGEYELTVRAWDIFNNPSEQSIRFTVTNSDELVIKNVYNYPNPFNTKTKFVIEHNQPNNPISVSIRIFTLTGRPILQLNEPLILTNSPFITIDWDGRDKDGDKLATGTYLYHLRVKAETLAGKQSKEIIEKLVIIN